VFLHGSGQDDRGQLDRDYLPQDFILLAPNGRGTSNAYTADRAQDDIREAVEDVCANYSVDRSRVVLAGFSMGGYGVYRTQFEDPKRYRALAVFSGHPDLGSRFTGSNQPNFLDDTNLAPFRGVPVFIFHGTRDRNCPFEDTQAVVRKLEKAGALVETRYEEGKGHELPSPQTAAAFLNWLGVASASQR
jgi:predicted esterase